MEMSVDLLGEHVILLTAVRTVPVGNQPELLQYVQRAVDRRGSGRLVAFATAGDQLRCRDVALLLAEDIDERPTLRGPPQAGGA
jgi:hypothetical protein